MTQKPKNMDDVEKQLDDLPGKIRELIRKQGCPGRIVVNVHHDSDGPKKIDGECLQKLDI